MKIHVANLSPKITEQELEKLFAESGQVLGVELKWNERAGRMTGDAVVDMHAYEAMAAMKRLNGRAFRNRRLYITPIHVTQKDDHAI